jgi:hypothetical protein
MTTILLVAGAIVVGLFIGIGRYGGWKRWTKDIRAGLRTQAEAGFLAAMAAYAGLLSAVGALSMWAIYTAHDVLRWSNLGQFSWGDPVWAADAVYPAAAAFFTLALLGMACLIQIVRRDMPNVPHATAMTRSALSTMGFGVATIVAMVWRINEEQLSALFWLYLLPVVAAVLVSVGALLMLLLADQARKESTTQASGPGVKRMIQSPQTIQASRAGIVYEATVAWHLEGPLWAVEITSAEFDPVGAQANDAFEALCLVRDQLEPRGWRIGVAGAQPDVWPSGMARDQGGGLRAYRMTQRGGESLVDTFEPVDPATVTTVAEQRAQADQVYEEIRRSGQNG